MAKQLTNIRDLTLSFVREPPHPSWRILKVIKVGDKELAAPEGSTPKRAPMEHELKTWPKEFQAVLEYTKRLDIRPNSDRDFQVGDTLYFREYCPEAKDYSGRALRTKVLWLMHGPIFGLPKLYTAMSIDKPLVPHVWVKGKDKKITKEDWECCDNCGYVRNATSDERSCKGRPRLDLRDEQDG